jgi:hypothetical protein
MKGDKTQELDNLFQLVNKSWHKGFALASQQEDADTDYLTILAEIQEMSAKYGFDIKGKQNKRKY